MTTRNIFHQLNKINTQDIEINPEDRCCERCQYWTGDYFNKQVYAKIDGKTVWVAQCVCPDDDRSPFLEITGGELPMFIQPCNCCEAFSMAEEVLEDIAAIRETNRRIDEQLKREAWA